MNMSDSVTLVGFFFQNLQAVAQHPGGCYLDLFQTRSSHSLVSLLLFQGPWTHPLVVLLLQLLGLVTFLFCFYS